MGDNNTFMHKQNNHTLSPSKMGGSNVWAKTSDGGNGNHNVSLPIILIKIKDDRMLPSLYISSLLVAIF